MRRAISWSSHYVPSPSAENADGTDPDHVVAPFSGVVTLGVSAVESAHAGQIVATIEAMKMEAAITAPKAGTVKRIVVSPTAQVEGGELLPVIALRQSPCRAA